LSNGLIGNAETLKVLNRSRILQLLRDRQVLSRSEIALITGLNGSTISILVRELIVEGIVREIGFGTSKVGRKPVALEINPKSRFALGVQIGDTRVAAVIIDLSGNIRGELEYPVAPNAQVSEVVAHATDGLKGLISGLKEDEGKLLGVGIGLAGLVDVERGVFIFGPNLTGRDVNVAEIVRARLKVTVAVDNEVNTMALGEQWFGAARQRQNVLCVSVGGGVGSGLLINGKIFRGANGGAGELGHMIIDPDGPQCGCGTRGCLEAVAGGRALCNEARKAAADHPDSLLRPVLSEQEESRIIELITKAFSGGDPHAKEIIVRVGRMLGTGIGNALNLCNPEVVVLGGEVIERCEPLAQIAMQVAKSVALGPMKGTHMVLPRVRRFAEAVGAATLVLDKMFDPLEAELVARAHEG